MHKSCVAAKNNHPRVQITKRTMAIRLLPTALRFIVCGVSAYIAFIAYLWQKLLATWLFGFIAVLFNPLIPIHLPREVWQLIDLTCALLFVAIAGTLRKPTKNKTKQVL